MSVEFSEDDVVKPDAKDIGWAKPGVTVVHVGFHQEAFRGVKGTIDSLVDGYDYKVHVQWWDDEDGDTLIHDIVDLKPVFDEPANVGALVLGLLREVKESEPVQVQV